MKIAIRYEAPSLEADFIAEKLNAVKIAPWDHCLEEFDIVICISPVSWCPPAKRKILLIAGMSVDECTDYKYDCIAVTSKKASKKAFAKFGHGCQIEKVLVPILDQQAARRRIISPKIQLIHMSTLAKASDQFLNHVNLDMMAAWAQPRNRSSRLFNPLEFNSKVKGGAIGIYVNMIDGYDLQVRRHLALGGLVITTKDSEVLEELTPFVLEPFDMMGRKLASLDSKKPRLSIWEARCKGSETDFVKQLKDLCNG